MEWVTRASDWHREVSGVPVDQEEYDNVSVVDVPYIQTSAEMR